MGSVFNSSNSFDDEIKQELGKHRQISVSLFLGFGKITNSQPNSSSGSTLRALCCTVARGGAQGHPQRIPFP